MIHMLAILLALSAFALLAMSMPRHQQDLVGRKLASAVSRRARVGGYALLLSVFVLDAFASGAAYGAVLWFGHLSIGAWGMVAWLCVRARGTKPASQSRDR